jgi:hypothetical protein
MVDRENGTAKWNGWYYHRVFVDRNSRFARVLSAEPQSSVVALVY